MGLPRNIFILVHEDWSLEFINAEDVSPKRYGFPNPIELKITIDTFNVICRRIEHDA